MGRCFSRVKSLFYKTVSRSGKYRINSLGVTRDQTYICSSYTEIQQNLDCSNRRFPFLNQKLYTYEPHYHSFLSYIKLRSFLFGYAFSSFAISYLVVHGCHSWLPVWTQYRLYHVVVQLGFLRSNQPCFIVMSNHSSSSLALFRCT